MVGNTNRQARRIQIGINDSFFDLIVPILLVYVFIFDAKICFIGILGILEFHYF